MSLFFFINSFNPPPAKPVPEWWDNSDEGDDDE